MDYNSNTNTNIKSSQKKGIKIDYNEYSKMPKVSNFFRGEIVSNNKQPKRLSYDKKEIFYTSRVKENELEPKLLLEKLPPAFNLKNNRNSNDSKNTNNTKYSSKEQKNNENKKMMLNNSNETSPEEMIKINFNNKNNREDNEKINNFFIQEEINLQRQLQNKKNNKNLSPYKIVTKHNNNLYKNIIVNHEYDKNVFIYNNTKNNNHLKTDYSEYDNLKSKNNLVENGFNHKYNNNNANIKNSVFNNNIGDIYKNSEQKYSLNTININNINNQNNYLYNNDTLNTSDLFKKKYRKSSDPEAYHTELNNIIPELKKNIRSGSYMDMINYQNILQTESQYSPISTNTNIHTLTNNNFSQGGNTIKENEVFKLSGNSALKPLFSQRKSSEKMQKLKSAKNYNNNIKSIKNITKIKKIPIITGGVFGGMNFNLKKYENNENINQRNKKEIANINEGISFRYYNGYKYYFNLRNANIYFLKELQYNNPIKGISTIINTWNKLFHNDNYLSIICRKINIPENNYTFVIEYPKGGDSIYNIINLIGLHEQKLIYKIISEIYNNIIILKNKENEIIKNYKNVPFCLCDVFLTINEEIKIMPPIIRKINKEKENNKNICQCLKNLEILKKIINMNDISLFCFGLFILQLITQNLLFKLKSYNILLSSIKKEKENIINRANTKCCLIHSILFIEKEKCNKNKDLLLSNFLSLFDDRLIKFIHQCTKFDNNNNYINYPNIDFMINNTKINNDINISIKELFKIMTSKENNDYISFNNFINTFEILYNDMKLNSTNFKKLLHENKVINVLIRNFNIDKNEFKTKLRKIINSNDNIECEEYDENQNFINSGSSFYRKSLRKKLENKNSINIDSNNENIKEKIINNNLIIFKNYNTSDNN